MTEDPNHTLALVSKIASLSNAIDNEKGFTDEKSRLQFVDATEKLAIAARRPDENIFFAITRITQDAAIRCAIGLNIFKLVPPEQGQSISAKEIASGAKASHVLIVRVMRALTACHVFEEVGEEQYIHNGLSRGFLVPESSNMFTEIYDLISKGTYALPDYLRKTNWQNPQSYEDSAFHLGQHTEHGFWEYIERDEELSKAFNSGMRSQATVSEFDSPYPFDLELNKSVSSPDDVVLVDVGGGRGHALERVKKRFPHLKGRFVLQDLDIVIKDAVAQGLAPGIEAQAASFFNPNPVKNAGAYFFRRVLHDWPDETCRQILVNTVSSMGPESKVLIAEYEVPAVAAPAKLTLQDLNMMAIGGMERTEQQWQELLESAGLRLAKVWRGQTGNFVMVEGRLKDLRN